SVEILKLSAPKETAIASWIKDNAFSRTAEDNRWGIIAQAKSKSPEEMQFLTLSFKRVLRVRWKLQAGRLERVEEEATEPEICEAHLRIRDELLELYSFTAKQRTLLVKSMNESFGEDSVSELFLSKDAMKSLMTEAIEVLSVSLTGLGNPFFSDATFTGTDPANSKTYRELLPSGEIKSFRGKFQSSGGDEVAGSPMLASISSSKCKVRIFGGQTPIAQSDVEEFVQRVANTASSPEKEKKKEIAT
ncbi:MAG: hypothetical protein OK457_04915, partial [Thaumarchaeota archaeon]|nr:hypothetical protein [Nitrososphaerota archaeon]